MKFVFFLTLFFVTVATIYSCGFKGSPSPAFGGSEDRMREEIARRQTMVTPVPTVQPAVTATASPKTKE